MDRSRIQKWEVAVPTPGASVSSGDEPCVCQRARACPETNKYVCVCSLTLRVPHTYPPCTSDKPVASTMAPWCQQPNRQVKSVSRWYSGLGPGTRRMGRGQPWLPVIGLPGHAVAEGDVGATQSLLCTLTRRNCSVMCACCVRDRAVGVVGVVSVVSVASSLVSVTDCATSSILFGQRQRRGAICGRIDRGRNGFWREVASADMSRSHS